MKSRIYHGVGSSQELPTPLNARRLFDAGPKIAEMREALEALRGSLVGDEEVYGVIGPLDDMVPAAYDVLLKTLEEMPEDRALILWARSEDKIPNTIRSRTPMEYLYRSSCNEEDLEEAQELLRAFLNRDLSKVVETADDNKILSDFILVLSRTPDVELWVSLREKMQDKNFDSDDLLSVLMSEMQKT